MAHIHSCIDQNPISTLSYLPDVSEEKDEYFSFAMEILKELPTSSLNDEKFLVDQHRFFRKENKGSNILLEEDELNRAETECVSQVGSDDFSRIENPSDLLLWLTEMDWDAFKD